MTDTRTTYRQAVSEYDPVHERVLMEAITTAIFEASQPFEQNLRCLAPPDVTDDSTHSATQYGSRHHYGQTCVNQALIVATASDVLGAGE